MDKKHEDPRHVNDGYKRKVQHKFYDESDRHVFNDGYERYDERWRTRSTKIQHTSTTDANESERYVGSEDTFTTDTNDAMDKTKNEIAQPKARPKNTKQKPGGIQASIIGWSRNRN
jgi:hypothetical protein